ncbi:MAG: hypothetical protein IT289_02455 [Oligoflexia bacterium]|nr:hypothetical protein [Oligoflexia bacterium]
MLSLNTRKSLAVIMAVAVGFSTSLPIFAQAESVASESAVQVSVNETQRAALRLLIYNAVLSRKVGGVVEITPEMRAKYTRVRMSVYGSPSFLVAGAGSWALAQKGSEKVEFIWRILTNVVRVIAESMERSSRVSWDFFEDIAKALKLDVSSEKSADSVRWTWDHLLMPIFNISMNGAVKYWLGASAVGTSGYASYLMYSDPQEALNHRVVRKILGKDAQMRKQVESIANEMAGIFLLNPDQQSAFKSALSEEILRQALAKGFDPKTEYQVDVVEILESRQLINSDVASTARSLRAIVQEVATSRPASEVGASTKDLLSSQLDAIAVLAAQLEEILATGKLSREDRKEALILLEDTKRVLSLVASNVN